LIFVGRSGSIFFAFLLTVSPAIGADKVDNRNFAIDTYSAKPNEIQLAERRAKRFWERKATRFGPEPRYLAVEVSSLTSYPGIGPKLMFSETTTSWYAHGNHQGSFSDLELTGHYDLRYKNGTIRQQSRLRVRRYSKSGTSGAIRILHRPVYWHGPMIASR
jgi:hypothetical protein